VFSRFFIDRPIFASAMSLVITLAGLVALPTLPLAQYPRITPPSIIVSCNYPGASAQVVAESVAAPIEQQVNGVEDMMYMSSQSANDGSYSLTVTFKPGVNLNFAQVLVQNRVNLALPLLPDVVKQTGLSMRKRNPDFLQIVNLYSPGGRYDQLYLSTFATTQVRDELLRVDGVGDVTNFGQQDFSMRIWVDPDRLASLNLTAGDLLGAVREQNRQFAAGHFGQPPHGKGEAFEFPIDTLGRLSEPEQFADIVLRTTPDGRQVRVGDIGRVELAARSEDVASKIDGHPASSLAVFQLPYANAIGTAARVRKKMEELKKKFPEDVEYLIGYDTSPYLEESVWGVVHTLAEAIALVAIVVLVFLQNWRSALIPMAAVPVAVIGTFAVMASIGFSLNNLTLFGLVLAIGIVVDDAIVVVEAVEYHIEEGMKPRQAAYRAMEQVSGPVVAVALVLSAVFVPCAFISGITGQFYRQFALTIAVSTIISAFNSLTLSPALAALLLQRRGARRDFVGRVIHFVFGWFFGLFNWCFRHATAGYLRAIGLALRGSALVLIVYGGLLLLTWFGFTHLPTGYIPTQDMRKLYVAVQLPDAASHERSQAIMDRISGIVSATPGVTHTTEIAGSSFTLGANGSNFGNCFVSLDDFDTRHRLARELGQDMRDTSIIARLQRKLNAEVPEAVIKVLGPPPVQGLGSAGGFKFVVEDRSGDNDINRLEKEANKLIAAGRKDPSVAGLFTVFRANTPQLYVDVNRVQCQAMGVNPNDVFQTLQVYLGSYYVNDFNKLGRTWQVVVQAEGEFRNDPHEVKRLKVRNADGEMVPLGAVLTIREIAGPILLYRYNMYPAAAIVGGTRRGVSSGQGIKAMQSLADRTLGPSMAYEWTEINFIQIDAAKNVWNRLIFPLAVVFVFLVLAAQYESWALPLAVILVVPMCILGSLTGVWVTHTDINIFTQVGFVVLVGLASKNAILIVEFAKHKHEEGHLSRREATLAACRLRLRPILMTSFAFILGVVPLLIASGAGAEMRHSLGTAVFSGMLGVTLFGIFLTPVFFYVIASLVEVPLFSSQRARQVGRVLRWGVSIATLGLPWLLRAILRRRVPAKQAVVSANGVPERNGKVAEAKEATPHDNGNGNGKVAESSGAARDDQTRGVMQN
jgi:multidrug efflux pump